MRILLLVWLWGLPWAFAVGGSEGANAWLEKMAGASERLNYKGTFVLIRGDDLETIQITHGVGPEGVRERLVSLNKEARELIRDQNERTCVSPAHRLVVVERGAKARGVSGISPQDLDRVKTHYRLALGEAGRVAGRACRWIEIQPRDVYRYGYRLCIDKASGLALHTEILGEARPIEQVIFTSLEVIDKPDGRDFEASMIAPGFIWYTPSDRQAQEALRPDSRWRFDQLPPGFSVSQNVIRSMATVAQPVQHIVITDGLAAVSVFISRARPKEIPPGALSGTGATHATTEVVDGHQLTIVGEVPAETVDMIARSARHDGVAPDD